MDNLKKLLIETINSVNTPNKWNRSTFGTIKGLSSSTKGEVGELFIAKLCNKFNIQQERNTQVKDSYDIKIVNNKVEVKTATEDINNRFQFNGIRYHRGYDYLLVLGIAPNNIFFNIYTAADVKTHKIGKLANMEKGAIGACKLTRKHNQLHEISKFKEIVEKTILRI